MRVVVHVCRGVPAAGGCEADCDRGVGGGEASVGIVVAFRGIAPSSWLHNCTQDSDITRTENLLLIIPKIPQP